MQELAHRVSRLLVGALLLQLIGAGCGDSAGSGSASGAPGGLFVRVTDANMAPVANAIVTTSPGTESLATDALASVFFPALPKGVYTVTAYHPSLGAARRATTIETDTIVELTIVLPKSATTVERDGGAPADAAPPPLGGARGTFEQAVCPFSSALQERTECGFVAVPENRAAPGGGRTIRIAVAILKARNGAGKPDPVVYLEGGPGAGAIESLPYFADLRSPLASLLADRDLVLVDQRGTGLSLPALPCPDPTMMEPTGAMMMIRDLEPEAQKALAACRANLVAGGADLGAYNTASNADDIDDVRFALGHERWNLLGVSYGTRLALEIMRRHPTSVRTVVLDSTLPPQVDLIAEHAGTVADSLKQVLVSCDAQPACQQLYPGLVRTLEDLLRRLQAAPPRLSVPGTGMVALDGTLFVDVLKTMLYSREGIEFLPALILATSRHDYEPIRAFLGHSAGQDDSISLAMHLSVMCSDEVPFTSRDALARAVALVDAWLRPFLASTAYFTSCDIWNVTASPPTANQPVTGAAPTLVLAGAFDPVTPPAWGELAASTQSDAHSFVFAGESHGVFITPCGASIVSAFVTTPTTRPDSTCLAGLREPEFVPPFR